MTATNISQRFHLQDGGKINWHRYGTKLRHCHPVYFRVSVKILNSIETAELTELVFCRRHFLLLTTYTLVS